MRWYENTIKGQKVEKKPIKRVPEEGVPRMFYGEYRHTLDDKNRLSIPSRFRLGLQGDGNDTFYLARGLDQCILLFTREKWKELENQLSTHAFTDASVRAFKRMFFSGAFPANCDRQGRVNVPQSLIDHAKVKRDVVVVGVSDWVEIWDSELWDGYLKGSLTTYEETAQKLTQNFLIKKEHE